MSAFIYHQGEGLTVLLQGNQAAKARKAMAKSLVPSGEETDPKQIRKMFQCYDLDGNGYLTWNEAKRYLNDLFELSGMQALIIRQAYDEGAENVAQWYEDYLRATFNQLDVNKDGKIFLGELVKHREDSVRQLLSTVTAAIKTPKQPGRANLVRSNRLPKEDVSNVAEGVECKNQCGFYAGPNSDGYCSTCFKLLANNLEISNDFLVSSDGDDNDDDNSIDQDVKPTAPPAVLVVSNDVKVNDDDDGDDDDDDDDDDDACLLMMMMMMM